MSIGDDEVSLADSDRALGAIMRALLMIGDHKARAATTINDD